MDSVIAKESSREKISWKTIYLSSIINSDSQLKGLMEKFIVWNPAFDCFYQMKGRGRFSLGFIQKLFEKITTERESIVKDVLEILRNWHEYTVLAERNGSLYNHLFKIHDGKYKVIYLEKGKLVNIPDIIKKLTLLGLSYSNFNYYELDDADTSDLINLGVCLVQKNKKTKQYSISEPWALEASVHLFNKFQIDISLRSVQDNLSEISNHANDSIKGKFLELLVASTLIQFKGKLFKDIPIFQTALHHPNAPEWFRNMSQTQFMFESFYYDTNGAQMISLLKKRRLSSIVLPPKAARSDLFCLFGNTVLLAGMKFYTRSIPLDKLQDNKRTTDVQNQYKPKKGKIKGKQEIQRTEFIAHYDEYIKGHPKEGAIRLLVTLPNCITKSNPISFERKKGRGTQDVIIEISKLNMEEFFDDQSCSILSKFYEKYTED